MKWILGVSTVAIAMGWVATATIPAAAVSIDEAALKFLPPETQSVAFIDVAALRGAPLLQDAFKDAGYVAGRREAEFLLATGLVPERDIDKVTIAKTGLNDGLAIVQGRIDQFKVEQFFQDKGQHPEPYLGRNVYRNGDTAFVIVDDSVVIGATTAVKKALDQVQLPGSLPLRSDLMAAIQTIEAGNQIWAAGDVSISELQRAGMRGPEPALEMLKSLKSGTYQMRVDADVHAQATGNFMDVDSPKNLADLARGALALARLQVARRRPEVVPLLDGIQISNSGTTLVVRIDAPGDLLTRLKDFYRPTLERPQQQ
jgi:hypothetical protein